MGHGERRVREQLRQDQRIEEMHVHARLGIHDRVQRIIPRPEKGPQFVGPQHALLAEKLPDPGVEGLRGRRVARAQHVEPAEGELVGDIDVRGAVRRAVPVQGPLGEQVAVRLGRSREKPRSSLRCWSSSAASGDLSSDASPVRVKTFFCTQLGSRALDTSASSRTTPSAVGRGEDAPHRVERGIGRPGSDRPRALPAPGRLPAPGSGASRRRPRSPAGSGVIPAAGSLPRLPLPRAA